MNTTTNASDGKPSLALVGTARRGARRNPAPASLAVAKANEWTDKQLEAKHRFKQIAECFRQHRVCYHKTCRMLFEFFDEGMYEHYRRADGSLAGDKTQLSFASAFGMDEAAVSRMIAWGRRLFLLRDSVELTAVNSLSGRATRPLVQLPDDDPDQLKEAIRRAEALAKEAADNHAARSAAHNGREEPFPKRPRVTEHNTRQAVDEILGKPVAAAGKKARKVTPEMVALTKQCVKIASTRLLELNIIELRNGLTDLLQLIDGARS